MPHYDQLDCCNGDDTRLSRRNPSQIWQVSWQIQTVHWRTSGELHWGHLGHRSCLVTQESTENVDTKQMLAGNDGNRDGDDGPRSCTCLICAKKFQFLNSNTSKDNHNTIESCGECSGMSEDISSLKNNFDKSTILVQTLVNGGTDEMKNIKESNAKLLIENNHPKQANTNLENRLKD